VPVFPAITFETIAVNLLRPRATPALSKLINRTLPPADTWETAISGAGQEGSEVTKADEWARLIKERRLGYFALLRNIRNIAQAITDPAVLDEFRAQLMDPDAVRKSLVLPFRFLTAFKVLSASGAPTPGISKVLLGSIHRHRRGARKRS
jgi:60 kDa SS-A/Ro ribonucleoprotein